MRQLALQQAPPVFPQDPFPFLTFPPHISAFLFLTVSAKSLFPCPQLLLAGHDLRVQTPPGFPEPHPFNLAPAS